MNDLLDRAYVIITGAEQRIKDLEQENKLLREAMEKIKECSGSSTLHYHLADGALEKIKGWEK